MHCDTTSSYKAFNDPLSEKAAEAAACQEVAGSSSRKLNAVPGAQHIVVMLLCALGLEPFGKHPCNPPGLTISTVDRSTP